MSMGSGELKGSFLIMVPREEVGLWVGSDCPGPCRLLVALFWYVFSTVRMVGVTNSVMSKKTKLSLGKDDKLKVLLNG